MKLALVGLVSVSAGAFAVTPANTTITNTAQLNYSGLTSPITASVNVTISLTPSAATVSTPIDQSVAENQSAAYVYVVTANANGSDIYNLTNSLSPTNLASTSANAVFTQGATTITSLTLGATAAGVVANIGSSTIQVPSDGVAGGGVNNIVAGDVVVIGGNVYTVLSVSDDGVNASITLTSNLTTVVAVGDLIAERQTFTATIADVGTVNPSGAAANVIMDVTVTSQADAGQVSTDQTLTTIVEVTFIKYVRNVTNANGSGAPTVINAQSYFATAGSVTAKTGDVLEYALLVKAPTTPLTGVSLLDTIPAYTTYVAASTKLNTVVVPDVAGNSALISGMPVNDTASPAGTVAASQTAVVTFQVTIN